MRIGLVGVGTIGTFLLDKINLEKRIPNYEITAIFDERKKAKTSLKDVEKKYNVQLYQDIEAFLQSSVDLVVECANIPVVQKYGEQILQQKDFFIISIGALVDDNFVQTLKQIGQQAGTKIYLPSGAIGGLDVLQAASSLGGLDTVSLTTRKPANALAEEVIKEEKILFTGKAKDAIVEFPKNANVSIILSLAGIGVEQTEVTIIADPAVEKNLHYVEATGDFGSLSLKLENDPSPTNPKTSYLTALSIFSAIQKLNSTIHIT